MGGSGGGEFNEREVENTCYIEGANSSITSHHITSQGLTVYGLNDRETRERITFHDDVNITSHATHGSLLRVEFATFFLVPTSSPVLFLTRVAAVPGGLALRANLELLQMAHNLAPFVLAIRSPLQRYATTLLELLDRTVSPLPQPMYYAGKDIRGDIVPLRDPSRRGDRGGIPHVPNLAGVGKVCVHVKSELRARFGVAVLGGLAQPPHRRLFAPRDAAP